jgi:DNA polymerase III alpha subunit
VGEYLELSGRFLLESGITVTSAKQLESSNSSLLKRVVPSALRVFSLSDKLREFNKFAIQPIAEFSPRDLEYNFTQDLTIPEAFKQINIVDVLNNLHGDYIVTKANFATYHTIFKQELAWFQTHNRIDILRTVYYIVHSLKTHNVPWGIGRGSSVYSYLLFLLGLHYIDPIEHELDYREFLRD